jgi:Rne/Rng family ribonuclease
MTGILALAVAPGEVRGVLLEDGVPVELLVERDVEASLIGGFYSARIARVAPALSGAFLDLGQGLTAFLPGAALPGGEAFVEGAGLTVKIVKDGFAHKAPEATAALEFVGRYVALTPWRPGIGVSRRLHSAERARLCEVLRPLLAPGEGAVLRSRAAIADDDAIAADLDAMRAAQAAILQKAAAATAPGRLDDPPDAIDRLAIGLDIEGGPERIVVDDRLCLARLRRVLPDPDRVEFDGAPDFALRHGLTEAFEQALAPRLSLAGGGEIVIEATEAFTAIDVNLAAAGGRRGHAGDAILAVNCAAAAAIARQLRLRAIGGAVVIDFITMGSREHRRLVDAAFMDAAAPDPVAVERHGWTGLGHMEATRRRVTASIADRLLAPGTPRRAKSALTVALELLRALATGILPPGRVELRVSAGVAAELRGRLAAAFEQAAARAGRQVAVAVETGRDPETFDIAAA